MKWLFNTPCQVSSASGSLYKDRRQGKPVSRLTSRRVSIPCETTLPKPDQVVNSVDFVYHNGTVVREARLQSQTYIPVYPQSWHRRGQTAYDMEFLSLSCSSDIFPDAIELGGQWGTMGDNVDNKGVALGDRFTVYSTSTP